MFSYEEFNLIHIIFVHNKRRNKTSGFSLYEMISNIQPDDLRKYHARI